MSTDNRHPAGTSIGGQWARGSAAEVDLDDAWESPGGQAWAKSVACPMNDLLLDAQILMISPGKRASRLREIAGRAPGKYLDECAATGVEPDEQALEQLRAISDRPRDPDGQADARESLNLAAAWRAQHVPEAPSFTAEQVRGKHAKWTDPRSTEERRRVSAHNSCMDIAREADDSAASVDPRSGDVYDAEGSKIEIDESARRDLRAFIAEKSLEDETLIRSSPLPPRRFFTGELPD